MLEVIAEVAFEAIKGKVASCLFVQQAIAKSNVTLVPLFSLGTFAL